MTIKELKELLEDYPESMEVVLLRPAGRYGSANAVYYDAELDPEFYIDKNQSNQLVIE